ncbi:MAG TPA: S41 family peptidase [Povalibacter sp.]|uniref:S41 family peptidase n=1 Tax=Povalibacter sp. TaxID=1962978 RepID=UPI002CB2AB28|nr:S41 family peptidase [Povalibacter sp.]HMN46141.1 S41 family peptidase [Povalibacter sp.]
MIAGRDFFVKFPIPVGALCAGALLLAGCGGQSSSQKGASSNGQNGSTVSYSAGVYPTYKGLANLCAAPRSGSSPVTGQAYPDKPGSIAAENNWLRSWSNDTYLWYRELPDLDPRAYNDTEQFFDLLRTSQVTASGTPKDKFHFTYPTEVWESLSQSGVSAGYGAQWFLVADRPPREIRVAYVEPGSPAAAQGVQRGDTVLRIDGADAVSGNDVDTLNDGLFPENIGEAHQFVMRSAAGVQRTVSMTSASITSVPVQNVKVINPTTDRIGYLLFNDHIATAEAQLISAVNTLNVTGISELVLDIRYNGGGYLYIASELAYMIAGPSRTNGKTFERLTFNDKYPNTDPVTGESLAPMPFFDDSDAGAALPTLNLGRVYVLTGSGTCSASESIINGLRGVGVEVIQIGGTTCGKPYGFYATPNCGTTYFTIQFKGVNAMGFGDYTDGFSPENVVGSAGTEIPGCAVLDDFTHALGDVGEARLAAALQHIGTGSCPTPPSGPVVLGKTQFGATPSEGYLPRSPLRENRILRH